MKKLIALMAAIAIGVNCSFALSADVEVT